MKTTPGERFKKIMIYLLAFYLLLLAAAYFLQQRIFFQPKPLPADYQFNFSQKFVEKQLKPDATSVTSVVQFLPETDSAKGVVLYFHGNRGNIERYARYTDIFTRNGYECWMADYPGFGKSTGSLTAKNILLQAEQLYLFARSRFKPEQILIYGKSMGTGPASFLAANQQAKALVLETPYYSLSSLARHYAPILPMKWLLNIDFDNGEMLQSVTEPVTVFHGTADRTIPLSNAIKLKPLLKPTDRFIVIDGGQHYGIPRYLEYQQQMDSLLEEVKSEK